MKIKLINKTEYRDEDLRAIVKAACRVAGVAAREVVLRLVYSRGSYVTGCATLPHRRSAIYRGHMTLRLPKPGKDAVGGTVAQVALHEAMHLAGADHSAMTEEQYHCRMPTPWADNLLLRIKEDKTGAPREEKLAAARADRLEHAQTMLRKATTRSKRADTLLKKWERRVKLLQRT